MNLKPSIFPTRPLWLGASALFFAAGTAGAYLGSFEELDGYRTPFNGNILSLDLAGDAKFYLNNLSANGFTGIVPSSTFPNTMGDLTHGPDLSRYNAGTYGTNAGGPGGTATDISDNSGLWRAQMGGRLNEDIGGTLANNYQYLGNTGGIPFQQNRDYVHAYRYTGARTGSQVLNFLAQDTDLRYDYSLDSRDLGGMNPNSTAGSIVTLSFWICPADADDTDPENVLGLTLRDSMGQSVFEVGYTGENILQYRMVGSSNWVNTGTVAGSTGWSEISLTLNAAADTISLSARGFDDGTSTLGGVDSILSSAALCLDAAALTELRWDVQGGALNNGALSFKNFFDDFNFSVAPVPEPGSALCVLCGLLFLFRRSRRGLTS